MNLAKQWFFMGGATTDVDAQAFFTAAGITDATQKSAVNTLVVALKAAGVWTLAKAIYPYVGGTAATHKWNLKDPRDLDAAFRITWDGAGVTHNANGVTFNGTSSYGNPYINPLTVFGTSYMCMHNYVRSGTLGILMGADSQNYWPYTTGAVPSAGLNAANGSASVFNTDGIQTGMMSLNRDANYTSFFMDGAKSALSPIPFTNNSNAALHIGKFGVAAGAPFLSNHNVAFSAITNQLTDAQTFAMHDAVYNYQVTLSRSMTKRNLYHFFGDSITWGFGIGKMERWTNLLSVAQGYNEANKAISGTTMETVASPPAMIDRLAEIPTKRANDIAIFIAYGYNDATNIQNTVAGFSVANFQANLATVIASCKTAGWSSTNIYIIDSWYPSSTKPSGFTTPYNQIISAAAAQCSTSGAMYINPITANIEGDLQGDLIHFTAAGNIKMKDYILAHL